MSSLFLYFVLKLDTIWNAMMLICIISAFCAFGVGLVYMFEKDSPKSSQDQSLLKTLSIVFKKSIAVFTFAFILCLVTPSTKQMAVIYLVPKIVNNEVVQQTANDGLEILKIKVHEYMEELKNKNNKDK